MNKIFEDQIDHEFIVKKEELIDPHLPKSNYNVDEQFYYFI